MKYNRKNIMNRAWEIKRLFKESRTFALCLRQAWKEAKEEAEVTAWEGREFENGMEITILGVTRTLSRWTKNGHDRVYINYGRKSDGYIDLAHGKNSLGNSYLYLARMATAIESMAF